MSVYADRVPTVPEPAGVVAGPLASYVGPLAGDRRAPQVVRDGWGGA